MHGRMIVQNCIHIIIPLITIIFLAFQSYCYADTLLSSSMGTTETSGKTLELRNGTLSFLCDDGSIANVKWGEITRLSVDDKVFITTNTNETIFSLLSIKDGKASLDSPSLGKISLSQQKITCLERKRKEVTPVFTVSAPLEQEIASLRAKGVQSTGPAQPEEKTEAKLEEKKEQKEQLKPEGKKVTTIGEQPADVKRPEEAFLRDEKVLLKKGQIEVEFNATYLDASRQPIQKINTNFNIPENENENPTFNSQFISRKVRDRSIVVPLTIRYGVTNNLLGYVTVPFAANLREISPEVNGERSSTHQTSGLGDVAFGANYQILHEGLWKPDLMFILSGKSATGKGPYNTLQTEGPIGTGFWDVTSGFSVVKSYDPAVLFANLTYSYIFQKGNIKPGDAINPTVGVGFAMNDELSMSFRVLGSYIWRARISGKTGGEIQTPFSFYVTLDKYITKNSYLEPAVSFGLTPDAPNFTIGISYVQRFR